MGNRVGREKERKLQKSAMEEAELKVLGRKG